MIRLKLEEVGRYNVTLTWKWEDDNNFGAPPTAYSLHRRLAGATTPMEMLAIVRRKKFIDFDLDPATEYEYMVETNGLPVTEVDRFAFFTEPENEFTDFVDFFTNFMAPTFGREFAGDAIHWCPQWWKHHEANKVMTELWRSYEAHRAPDDPSEPTSEQAEWLVMFAYPLMAQLWDQYGTFRGCDCNPDGRGGHADIIRSQPLPHTIDPTGTYAPQLILRP